MTNMFTIPPNHVNPLIDEWRTCQSPVRMIEMLGDKADNKRLLSFSVECDRILNSRSLHKIRYNDPSGVAYWTSAAAWSNRDCTVKPDEACNIIRCLWPNPSIERERVECPECEGTGAVVWPMEEGGSPLLQCPECKGKRTVPAPIIDPRWLTGNVLDLARAIRGIGPRWHCDNCGVENGTADFWCYCGDKASRLKREAEPPRPELMPILGDALMDAWCDDDEVIRHCQSEGPHVAGCWVIEGVLG